MENSLPPIPAKRYFTIGEVGELCGVKPHVLRYWEQEFTQLRPMKRRGNRRYYQHHEVLMIRRIRELLYEQGFTISGARNKLQELAQVEREEKRRRDDDEDVIDVIDLDAVIHEDDTVVVSATVPEASAQTSVWAEVRRELLEIRELLRLSS
ncbi:MAG: MerR family transcriptional regulator [Hydrogenophaga sp.]|uniref:MerR family transcriptional regulator n=1 Tax=Hydrogenophaga sp. TaxID=1904254 RepID=UPI001D24B920|nr:MerR family transcriptional regulator [Hydrogenophaga sp.]MBX3610263.1 MerR family transcriptional regulator [Hydrogenophaga sp.]